MIPFSNFAKIVRTRGYARIDRWDQKRIVTVSADVENEVITSTEANALLREEFRNISERYPGYSLYFGGEAEDTRESLQSLFRAFIIAFLAIYLILGGVFKSFLQPFVVMAALPFSIVGVVLGFSLIGEPLSFMAFFGVIALAGVVVNDSLILVDFINQSRARGIPTVVAVVKSAKVRFRPVILTTVTTIGGLLPLALTSTGQAAFLAPMALAIVFGLGFATVLTLLVVPSFYLIAYDLTQGMKRLIGISQQSRLTSA